MVSGRKGGWSGKHGSRCAAAVAGMRADIKTRPVEHRLDVWRLDRHANGNVGGNSRAIEREQAEARARQYALPGSSAAVHRVKFPSAGILRISFVITANLQVRCDPGKQMKSSPPALLLGIGELPGQNRIKPRRRPSRSLLRVICNCKKHRSRCGFMAWPSDARATPLSSDRPGSKKVTRPGGQPGGSGCGTGGMRPPVPDEGCTMRAGWSEAGCES